MKLQKVIFRLEDGRKKYATHNGRMLTWEQCEIEAMRENMERYGGGAFTADFMRYDVEISKLRERYTLAKIIRITGFEMEDHDKPLQDDVIF